MGGTDITAGDRAGEGMARLVREHDWATTPLGPVDRWSPALRATIDLVLAHGFPMALLWGPSLVRIYNNRFRDLLGDAHPAALGQPAGEARPETWHVDAQVRDRVWHGEALTLEDVLHPIVRGGVPEDAWFTLSCSPVADRGVVSGILVTAVDTTARVLAERAHAAAHQRADRRHAFLLTLGDALRPLTDPVGIQDTATSLLGQHLGASRAYYFRAEEDGEGGRIHVVDSDGWRAAGAASMMGRRSHAALGAAITDGLAEGRTVSIADVRALALSADQRVMLEALDVGAVAVVPVVKAGRYRGGIALVEPHARDWMPEEIALAADVAVRTWEAVERARAEAALRASEERLRSAIEVGGLGLWDWNLVTGEVHWSDEYFRMGGYQVGEVIPSYDRWIERLHPEDRADAEAGLRLARASRQQYAHQFRMIRPGVGVRWMTARGRFFYDPSGVAVRMVGAMMDVTDGHLWEQRLQLLVDELQHRVRNILTVIRSVFARTVEAGGDIEDIADHFKGRLDSLARTQTIVTQSAMGTVDLESLIRDELLSVGISDGPTLTIDGPDVDLPGKAAETLGLAIHELTTNALKFGALKIEGASIKIYWSVNLDCSGQRVLDLNWKEQGVPAIPLKPARQGFGSELIEEALPYRLGAETKLQFRGGGVSCVIRVPLPDQGASSADRWKDY